MGKCCLLCLSMVHSMHEGTAHVFLVRAVHGKAQRAFALSCECCAWQGSACSSNLHLCPSGSFPSQTAYYMPEHVKACIESLSAHQGPGNVPAGRMANVYIQLEHIPSLLTTTTHAPIGGQAAERACDIDMRRFAVQRGRKAGRLPEGDQGNAAKSCIHRVVVEHRDRRGCRDANQPRRAPVRVRAHLLVFRTIVVWKNNAEPHAHDNSQQVTSAWEHQPKHALRAYLDARQEYEETISDIHLRFIVRQNNAIGTRQNQGEYSGQTWMPQYLGWTMVLPRATPAAPSAMPRPRTLSTTLPNSA